MRLLSKADRLTLARAEKEDIRESAALTRKRERK